MAIEGIEVESISGFIDYLKKSYGGIDEGTVQAMKNIDWSGDWKNQVFEGKEIVDSQFNYSIILFEKREDSLVDCKYALHKLDMRKSIETYAKKGYFSMLGKYFTAWQLESSVEKGLSKETMENLRNFFRYKAYKALHDQGKIEEIPVVAPTKSIEEILSPPTLHDNDPDIRQSVTEESQLTKRGRNNRQNSTQNQRNPHATHEYDIMDGKTNWGPWY